MLTPNDMPAELVNAIAQYVQAKAEARGHRVLFSSRMEIVALAHEAIERGVDVYVERVRYFDNGDKAGYARGYLAGQRAERQENDTP